jgi:hypothetical protein
MPGRVKMYSPAVQRAAFALASRDPGVTRATRSAARDLRDDMAERAGAGGEHLAVVRYYDTVTRRVSHRITYPPQFFYMWFKEFGTIRQPAQPHIRPVLDAAGGRVAD